MRHLLSLRHMQTPFSLVHKKFYPLEIRFPVVDLYLRHNKLHLYHYNKYKL